MNIHEYGIPHSANEIAQNIWQFRIFLKWPLPWHENKIAIFMLAQNEIVLN